MRRQLYNAISVLFSAIKFAVLRLIHGSHFRYEGIQRFSPNTEVIIADDGTLELGKKSVPTGAPSCQFPEPVS